MSTPKALLPLLVCALLTFACRYIVLPEGIDTGPGGGKGWSARATSVKSEDGNLRIELAIQNETNDWSAMQAVAGKPAILSAGGKTTNCDTVVVGTGGHRLAPGFQMRGFTGGTRAEPVIQPLYVECPGAEATAGATLAIQYVYFTGWYNYYEPEANKGEGTLEVNLDEVATDLTYPIAEPVEGLIRPPDTEITAINDVALTLTNVERTDSGLRFSWKTANPGEYPSYVHIGIPPVIGVDGIIYGIYETPDLASVPITPAGGEAEWTTEVAVPQDATGLYILLSVETGKQRLYANYAIDITK